MYLRVRYVGEAHLRPLGPIAFRPATARERLSLIETVRDPWTIRNLRKVGIREGWHCLDSSPVDL
jgi:hypothetical protein